MELLAPEKRRAVRMIREELCCKLCGRVFEDPHCLDCKHNFCRECIFLYLRKSESSCPKCKLPTRPSEITKNQFLQSILSAWKAVEQSLAPLEDPNSAVLLEKHEQQEEEKARRVREQTTAKSTTRGPVPKNKWNINTYELKQEADAAEREANAIEMFGGSLVQRAALKSAVLDAKNKAAAEALVQPPKAEEAPMRAIKPNGFGAAHLRKMANGHANGTVRIQSAHLSATQDDMSQTQTQMPNSAVDSQLMSPPARIIRRHSPFSPSETPSPNGTSLSSISSPFSVMGTQDVQGYMKKIQAQNHFLDEWAKKSKTTTSRVQIPVAGFGAKSPTASGGVTSVISKADTHTIPTISAVQRVQELMAGTPSSPASKKSPGKRKRQVFSTIADESDAEEEEEEPDQTQMTSRMADSPDLLGFGDVAPPVSGGTSARRQSLSVKPASSRLGGASDESNDEDDEEVDDDEDDETWVDRRSTKRATGKTGSATQQRAFRRRVMVPSSQAPPEVVDMTLDDDDDDEAVEDSQMPGMGPVHPAKKKRMSEDFKAAINIFQQAAGGGHSKGHLHRLSGAHDPEVDSPPSVSSPHGPAKHVPAKGIVTSSSCHTSHTSSVAVTQTSVPTRPPLATTTATNSARGKGRSSAHTTNYVFVGTDLTRDEIKSVITACNRLGGRFGRDFDVKRWASGAIASSVTHLITKSVPSIQGSEDLGLRCKRTAKYMRALAEGTFVVDYSWVEASVAHGEWLPEDKYEMSGDIYSDAVGKPRESRLRRIRTGNRNDIFRTFQFVLLCPENEFDFNIDSLRAIVQHFGVNVETTHTGNRLPETPRGKTNLGIVSKVMEPVDARRLWDLYQIPIVRVTWIFDSISHLEILPFDDYYPY